MSRKTKKKKIAAELRRRTQPVGFASPNLLTETSVVDANSQINRYALPKVTSENVAPTMQNQYSYVSSDLKRIVVLTALAFCAQVVLWLVLK